MILSYWVIIMYVLNFCSNSDILQVLLIVKLLLRIITIILPIIMIINLVITSFQSVINEQKLKNNLLQNFKQLIAALLVFFIPTIIEFSIGLVSTEKNKYMPCIENATIENIKQLKIEKAEELINKTYEEYDYSTYQDAKAAIAKIDDEAIREEYYKRLNDAEKVYNIKISLSLVQKGTTEQKKSALQNQIYSLKDEKIKTILNEELSKIPILEGSGANLNVESSFKEYTTDNATLQHYSLYIPKKAKENMPLIVVVPSSTGNYSQTSQVFKNLELHNLNAFLVVVESGADKESSRKAIINQIDQLVSEYKLNENAISVTGFSSSGSYVYNLVLNNKGKFAALVPVSSGYSFSNLSQEDIAYLKSLPMRGYGEKGGKYDASGKACAGWTNWSPATSMTKMFTGLGKIADFTDLGGICHNTVMNTTFGIDENNDGLSDILEWMSEQKK